MRYTVVLQRPEPENPKPESFQDDGCQQSIAVWVPGLPGCVSQGATEEEALENIADAIQAYLSVVSENLAGLETREVYVAA